MGGMRFAGGGVMAFFRTGASPETVDSLRKARKEFALYKETESFLSRLRFRRMFPRLRKEIDPTYYRLRFTMVVWHARERNETEASFRVIREYKQTLRPYVVGGGK